MEPVELDEYPSFRHSGQVHASHIDVICSVAQNGTLTNTGDEELQRDVMAMIDLKFLACSVLVKAQTASPTSYVQHKC